MNARDQHLHSRALELAATRLDFALTPVEAAELEAHLVVCATCARGAGGLHADAAALRRPAELATSYRLDAAIGAAIAGRAARRSSGQYLVLLAATVLLLVAMLGVAAAGASFLRERLATVVVPSPSAPAVVVVPSPTPQAATEPPSPTPAQTPSPTPVPTFAAERKWVRVADQAAFADAGMSAVAFGPGGYVAVGCATATELDAAECSGAAWTSPDGRAWRRSSVTSADHLRLGGVVAGGPGYLAWAYDVGAAFWASPDGVEWQRAPTIPSFAYAMVDSVVWFNDRFYAMGSSDEAPLAWTSPDGLTWSPVDLSVGCTTDPPANGGVPVPSGAVVAIDDRLISWGSIYADPGYQRLVARSTDGACWDVGLGPTGSSDGWLNVAVRYRDGLVGVGKQHDGPDAGAGSITAPIAAWSSPYGWTWTAASFASGPPPGELTLVANAGGHLVALGTDANMAPIAWGSDDGLTWSEEPSVPDAALEGPVADACTGGPCGYRTTVDGLAAGPGLLVAVGRTELADGGTRAVVWTSP
ncbi:MAG: hypothetical protein MUC54_03720 [Chloroflexi bacterium]|nr:hypothetical protein [Chloroflexota bacterium]